MGNPLIQLSTRFKNNQYILRVGYICECKQVVQFERILCLGGVKQAYHNINGENLKTIRPNYSKSGFLKQFILRDDDQYALNRAEENLILIQISQNLIKQSQVFYDWKTLLDISIFYQGWLVVYNSTHLNYLRFQPQEDDQWYLDKQHDFLIQGIIQIQYDPITEQIFYQNGDQNLYYFKSSLKGDTINKEPECTLNLPQLLKPLKIYQLKTRITIIQIIIQENKSYIFVSTSYGNIWNISIKTPIQDFKVINMYIVSGPSLKVQDIQIVDNLVLVQNENFQTLYKNTPNQSLDRPNLPLQGISPSKFMWLLKKDSRIVHIYSDTYGIDFYQNNIDDEVFLTINNLTTYEHKYFQYVLLMVIDRRRKLIINQFSHDNDDYNDNDDNDDNDNDNDDDDDDDDKKDEEDKSDKSKLLRYIWIALFINVLMIAVGSYYCFKNRRQSVEPSNEVSQSLEIEQV